MNDRIMVKVTAMERCLSFRTVSRSGKLPHSFLILKAEFSRLEQEAQVISHDISSFAVLRRDPASDTVTIQFHWLDSHGDLLRGYRQTVVLPYTELARFSAAARDADQWKGLSIVRKANPQFVFCAKETLHRILSSKPIRRKFVRFLRDNFKWADVEQICFYSGFVPYSFFFRCIQTGSRPLEGGLILHGQENLQTAYYAIHT